MEFKKLMTAASLMAAMTFGATTASADQGAYDAFNARFLTNSSCVTCHSGTPGTLYQIGNDWVSAGGTKDAGPSVWTTFDAAHATTYGGVDPNWVAPSTGGTSSSESSGGCVTSSVTTPLMMLLGMLTLGFFIRRKKD